MSYVPPPLSFQTPCSACAHVFAHGSQEAHANPLDLLPGCHEKVLDPVLTIHHSSPRPQICSAEQKACVSCHIQNGIANNHSDEIPRDGYFASAIIPKGKYS